MTLKAQLEDAERKIRDLTDEVAKVKGLARPSFDIPPDWVLKAAFGALHRTKDSSWEDAYAVLTGYYGLPRLEAKINASKVPENAVACYYPWENRAYSRGSIDSHTAMHELAHHICSKRPIKIDGEAEQAFCDAFADAITLRGIL